MSAPALVVLAAGLGSRYGGDKQFDRIGPGGSTLMDYAVFDAWRSGFGQVVFVVRPEHAVEMGPVLRGRYGKGLTVTVALQRVEDLPPGVPRPAGRERPWGTTQAVLAAAPELSGPFAVLNADDFYGHHAIESAAVFLREGHASDHHGVIGYPLAMTASPHGGVNRAMLDRDPDGTLLGVTELRDVVAQADGTFAGQAPEGTRRVAGDALVSMNLWAFSHGAIDPLREAFSAFLEVSPPATAECYLPDAVQRMIRRGTGRVTVLPTRSRWCGVTYLADRPWVASTLAELVGSGEYPGRLWD